VEYISKKNGREDHRMKCKHETQEEEMKDVMKETTN